MIEVPWSERPWSDHARRALAELVATGNDFTADDLIALVGTHAPNGTNNTIGSVIGAARKRGEIVAVGTVKSTQPRRRGGMVRLWAPVTR